MDAMSEKFNNKKKGNCQKLFSFVTRSCQRFQNFGIHSSMSVKNVIEKL